MKHSTFFTTVLIAAALLCYLPTSARAGEIKFKEGRWRLEGQAMSSLYSRKTLREGDHFNTFSIEYEMPAWKRMTLGLRAYPAFYYMPHKSSDKEVFGAAFGVTSRCYQNAEELNGWFGEIGGSLLWHSNHFSENGSKVNFYLEAGAGYQFENDWHVALKYGHISNASTNSDNAGINALGLAVGYTF